MPHVSPEAPRNDARASSLMAQEAAEAPRVVGDLLTRNAEAVGELTAELRARPPRLVLTCARGSSDHAATYAKYLIETRLGLITASAAPSVSSVYGSATDAGDVLAMAISQSGASPDLIATAEAAKAGGATLVALVNAPNSPLAAIADAELPLWAGPELSVAATKSYLAALAGIAQVVAAWSEDAALEAALADLPAKMAAARQCDWSPALEVLEDAQSLYVLGRGPGFAAAQEAALKFKETCGLHAEAFSAAEVRHGPMALARDGFPVLILAQDDQTREGVEQLAAELAAAGANVLLAGGTAPGAIALPSVAADPLLQPVLLAQSFYGMVERLARERGFDPDRPPGLAKVTRTV
ncbi:SIS domain-containing protein [Phenylobacterium sp. J367]|uniref:SIS domain-containing protein n=1 Tax=Phenylobacterium sp. J367 TaxID=2898435 RepID=UPI00215163E3|nr:SIS domain-containing protein [Phenylobacterium sp. J367]MCR5879374.1 SIS domain-containing protein [Phenylobacterium sp. J367]